MFVALALIAASAYLGVGHTVRHQLDETLWGSARAAGDVIAVYRTLPEHGDGADRRRFVAELDHLVVVRDGDGRILQSNSPFARTLPLDSASLRIARDGGRSWATGVWRGDPVRSLYAALPGDSVAVIQVAASLLPLAEEQRTVLFLLASTVVLGTAATVIGSGWLTRSALAPVAEIAAQASAIAGDRSGQRITAHADVIECQQLIDVLNSMVTRLERATEWHRRMIRDLGHDLRTPITALRAGVEVALWGERRPDEYRRVLGSAMEEIERLTLISDALVLLGRLESGALKLERAPLDLAGVAADAVHRVQQRIGAHVFRFSAPAAPAIVFGDARLLGVAVDQLLDNAKRHTPPGTTIELSIAGRDGPIALFIEDNGPGVGDELLPHLFEPFFRTDPARGRESGPGLGLTLVAAIIELHGGGARAERSEQGGLRVRLELPSVAEPVPTAVTPPRYLGDRSV
jgi:signal transduction histidine kinase